MSLYNITPATSGGVGHRRVASLAFAVTNRREIVGPLAALYLHRGSCCYISASCTSLPLIDILKELLNEEDHVCELVELDSQSSAVGVFRPASLLDDYRYRPLALEDVCLYGFAMRHFRRKQSSSTLPSALFRQEHPLATTHCVGTHHTETVPVITGVRMPLVDAESLRDIVLKRSRCALALFKPFSSTSDLVTDATSDAAWGDAHHAWEPGRFNFVREVIANIDDYHRVEKQAKDEAAAHANESGTAPSATSSDDNNDDIAATHDEVDNLGENGSTQNDRSCVDDFCTLCDTDGVTGFGDELPVFRTAGTTFSVNDPVIDYEQLLQTPAETTATSFNYLHQLPTQTLPDLMMEEFTKWLNDSATDEAAPSEHFNAEHPTIVIELLRNALDPSSMQWAPTDRTEAPAIEHYASITTVSRAFRLNERQHVAFTIIATALLRRFLRQVQSGLGMTSANSDQEFRQQLGHEQLRMLIGGAGGTGKTRVIDAVSAFCASWHRENVFTKTALTEKAASLIGARTLAGFLMRLKRAICVKRFDPLDLLVIDEVTMMAKPEWLRLDKLLRRYKQVDDVPFGGVHIVLVGDFLQLPPAGGDSIYVDCQTKSRPSAIDTEGFQLWRMVTTVVVLTDSVRFRSDPEWGEGCEKARIGEWTPRFVEIINSRVLQLDGNPDSSQSTNSSVFVTPENAKRTAINNAFVAETARRLPPGVYPLRVVADFHGLVKKLSRSDVSHILSQPDNHFGCMAPYLDLINGMPVQVTQNVGVPKGVANGTLGTLGNVHFPSPPTLQLVRDGASGILVQMPSHPPDYALLRLPRPRAVPIRPGLDPEFFPVFFNTQPFNASKISLPRAPNGEHRILAVRIRQFPFVCAVGSTVYKVQGETLDDMVVMDWLSEVRRINKPQQAYLLVSRVTLRCAFRTMLPFTPELAKWLRPPTKALQEEQRLAELSDRTMATFYARATAGTQQAGTEASSSRTTSAWYAGAQ